ncbi:MAG: hypothetical protein V4562_09460 [Pseudomonadota bacterium]
MLASERVAIAAHLHVVLRRKTGRVTDVEWMAANAEYAAEIVRYTRTRAAEDNIPELLEWADKLERAMATPLATPRRPLLQTLAAAHASPAATPAAMPEPASGQPPEDAASRYVGGLR